MLRLLSARGESCERREIEFGAMMRGQRCLKGRGGLAMIG